MHKVLFQKRDEDAPARTLLLKHRFHLPRGDTARSGKVTDEAIATNDVRLAEIHWADVNDGRFVANRAVNLQDRVMDAIDPHVAKGQCVSWRGFVAEVRLGRKNKIVVAQDSEPLTL